MDIIDQEVEKLKGMLKRLQEEVPDEKNASRNFDWTFKITRRIIRIFVEKDNKNAEEILVELLNHENEGIQFLVLCALLDAENRGVKLQTKTEIRLVQFKNSPIHQRIYEMVYSSLNAEKACLN